MKARRRTGSRRTRALRAVPAPAIARASPRAGFWWALGIAVVVYLLSRTKAGEAVTAEAADAVASAIDRLLSNEGGFAVSDRENGGAVNFGIDLATLQAIRPGATLADLRALTQAEARAIYLDYYVKRPGFDRLPPALIPQVVDISANSGPSRAGKLLQQALNAVSGAGLAADGVVGPATLAAAFSAVGTFGSAVVNDALVDAREAFHRALAEQNPTKYGPSLADWLTRDEKYRNG